MAMLNNPTQCFQCKLLQNDPILCKSCLKVFCQNDFNEHQQILNEQLNLIINDYDQFRQQRINEYKQNLQNDLLIKEIDQWENNSIRIIRKAAENCREKVVENSKTNFNEIEKKFNKLSEEIKEFQRENEFNEINLNNLKRKFYKVNEEFNNQLNISIQQDNRGFIKKISILSSNNNSHLPSTDYFNNLIKKLSSYQQKEIKFQLNGNDIATQNEYGQLAHSIQPLGILVDENKTIFIADSWGDRIVEWKLNEKRTQIVIGENEKGGRTDQLKYPTDMIIDQQNHSFIIADRRNKRVIRWSRNSKEEILIENICCYGLTMDQHGFLYVSDSEKNEVRKWNLEKIYENNQGILVAGGNGKGNELNQLNKPTFICVDKDQSIYITDQENFRVMKWRKDEKEGVVVAGGNGQGYKLNQLNHPTGLVVDEWNQIYVADCWNNRIMRWCEGNRDGSIIVGGNGKGGQSNQLDCPTGLSFDLEGNLYVADYENRRIIRFNKIH